MELTEAQSFVVRNLMLSAGVPLVIVALLYATKRIPRWVAEVYAASFWICALGWELWYTYGLVGGLPVDARRPAAMNEAIPIHVNWILTSLFDAAVCVLGLLVVWALYGFRDTAFKAWKVPAVAAIAAWFVGQNVYVEYVIHDQVRPGLPLSWAPLIPTGPWWNFTLFELGGRAITFQTQLPWVLMVPIFFALVFWRYRHSQTATAR